jgi:hypothetical protein
MIIRLSQEKNCSSSRNHRLARCAAGASSARPPHRRHESSMVSIDKLPPVRSAPHRPQAANGHAADKSQRRYAAGAFAEHPLLGAIDRPPHL